MGCSRGEGVMELPVFYVRPEDVGDGILALREEEVHHVRVLRLRPGDPIQTVDGRGQWFLAEIEKMADGVVWARPISEGKWVGEPEVRATLAVGLLKGERFDLLVEKTTELGVHRIIPLITKYAVRHSISPSRTERWRRIARAAMKQCGRSWLPEVSEPIPLEKALGEMADMELKLIAWERERNRGLREVLPEHKVRSVGVLVGPEGGFTEEEVASARKAGFIPLSLGPRRLRSETAGILALGFLMHAWEEPRPDAETGDG